MNNPNEGVHTQADPKGRGWVNTVNGAVKSRHKNKKLAVEAGRRLARRHAEQYTIHNAEGGVMQTKSYEISPLEG